MHVIPLFPLIDINAQARKLQRNRAKGTLTLPRSSNSSFCRSLSETSLNQVGPLLTNSSDDAPGFFNSPNNINPCMFLCVFLSACPAWGGRGAQAILFHLARTTKGQRTWRTLQQSEERRGESGSRRGETLPVPVPSSSSATGIQSTGEDDEIFYNASKISLNTLILFFHLATK